MQHLILSLSPTSVPGTLVTNTVLVGGVALLHVLFATFLIGSCTLWRSARGSRW